MAWVRENIEGCVKVGPVDGKYQTQMKRSRTDKESTKGRMPSRSNSTRRERCSSDTKAVRFPYVILGTPEQIVRVNVSEGR